MELHEREFFVSRIDAGYIKYKVGQTELYIHPCPKDIMYDANELYRDIYSRALLKGILTIPYTFKAMKSLGIWTETMDSDYKKLPKHLDDLKVGLFEAAFKTNERKKLRKFISEGKKEYERLSNIKHAWDQFTVEGTASFSKWCHIIMNCTKYKNGNVYNWEQEPLSVSNALDHYRSNMLSDTQLREIARTNPWTAIWVTRKANRTPLFEGELTHERQALIMWSRTYDSISESPESPHQDIIADDDMLDGWLIMQHRKRDKEQHHQGFSKFTDNQKIANADEVFIPADTLADAKKIDLLNSPGGLRDKRLRSRQIDRDGEVKLENFVDVQQHLRMEATKAMVNHVKGN